MKEKNIEPIFRQNKDGRLCGVSFIDYQNKTILNGSRLGKEFAANVFHEMFTEKNRSATLGIEITENKVDLDFIASLFPSLFE